MSLTLSRSWQFMDKKLEQDFALNSQVKEKRNGNDKQKMNISSRRGVLCRIYASDSEGTHDVSDG